MNVLFSLKFNIFTSDKTIYDYDENRKSYNNGYT